MSRLTLLNVKRSLQVNLRMLVMLNLARHHGSSWPNQHPVLLQMQEACKLASCRCK